MSEAMGQAKCKTPKYMHLFCEDCGVTIAERHTVQRWSTSDDIALIKLYPDFKAMPAAVSKELLVCIERCYKLRLHHPRKQWSDRENQVLRKVFKHYSKEEILCLLPGRAWHSIAMQASKLGVHRVRKRRGFSKTGIKLFDDIFARAQDLNFSLRDLDEEGGVRGYFTDLAPSPFVRIDAIEKVIEALGGELQIRWDDA
ncbi:hypothetical protein [Methylobacterium sp. AMS5]|uniref:hypothetical protein n=1 Tax=Methylobacterium sp. AMS5 TaxID=925818 RepID=UPI00118731B9|nr:hypothetical protein [Methylobacterium sp. AMS5]